MRWMMEEKIELIKHIIMLLKKYDKDFVIDILETVIKNSETVTKNA